MGKVALQDQDVPKITCREFQRRAGYLGNRGGSVVLIVQLSSRKVSCVNQMLRDQVLGEFSSQ